MADVKRIAMAGGTLACIGAIGFFMQSGANVPPGKKPVSAAGMTNAAADVNNVPSPPEISEISLTSGDAELPKAPVVPEETVQVVAQVDEPIVTPEQVEKPVEVSLLDTTPIIPEAEPAAREEPKIVESCDITMSGTEIAGALVKLDLRAPCLPNERVTVHHNGMMFTESTDAVGTLNIAVPALAENAVFIASFPNSEGAVANVKVTSLDLYDRAVLQSEIVNSISLHALEYGAGYNDQGHIWANATGELADAAIGKGGFMLMLGNPAISDATMAQVYTFPTGLAELPGDISLSAEIEVTSMNCGLDVEAQSLQVSAGGQPKVQTLDLTMPDCDAVGDFLVLKNLVNDLKVAAVTQ